MLQVQGLSILLLLQLIQGQFGDLFSPIPSPSPIKGEWEIHSFLEDSGMLNHMIMHADFDAEENLWVATNYGLYRYDGYEWIKFTTQDGLPTNFIRCVLWTGKGLLVGTAEGAGIFDWEKNTFDTMESEKHLPSSQIRRIIQDPDGTLWFCCDRWPRANAQGGLTRYKNGEWKTYTKEDGLPSNFVKNYFYASDGRQFVFTTKGLAQKQGENWRTILLEDLSGLWNAVEKDGVLFIASQNVIYTYSNNQWNTINLSKIDQNYIVCQTRDKRIFTSVLINSNQRQLFEWDGDMFHAVSPVFSHQQDNIEQLIEAPDQSIWIVGPEILMNWQPIQNEWIAYDSLPSPSCYDRDNRVWFSDTNKTVVKDGDQWYSSSTSYNKIKKDRENNLWALSDDGLTHWNQNRFKHYSESDMDLDQIIYFFIDHNNSVWVLGKDLQGQIVVTTQVEDYWKSFSHPLLQQLQFIGGAPDKEGGFLILKQGEIDHQILSFNHSSAKVIAIPQQHQTVFNHIGLYAVDHFLWYFGTTGLHRLNRSSDQWKEFEDAIYLMIQMGMESEDALWFSANGLDEKSGSIITIKNDDVKIYPGINVHSINNTNPNELLFGGEGYIHLISEKTRWKPHHVHIPLDSTVQEIMGTHKDIWLRVNKLTLHYEPNRLQPYPYINGSDVEVHQNKSIEFQFQSKRKFIPNVSDYMYQYSWSLDGSQWSEYAYKDNLLFHAEELSVGEHQLEVNSMSSNFQTSIEPVKYTFTVLPIPLQQRSWFVMAVISLIFLFLLLSLIAFISRHQYRILATQLEDEVESRTFELQKSKEQLQGLSQRLISIREEEQTRIARDLHDDLGHSLTSIKMELNKLAKSVTQNDERISNQITVLDQLGYIGNIVNNTVKSVRMICSGLRPTMLDNLGLVPTIQWEVEQFIKESNIHCHLDLPNSIDLTSKQSTTLYRILQESLTNIARHSEADLVKITIHILENQIEMVIQDNGVGLIFENSNLHQSNGLFGIQERARMMGGTAEFMSEPGQGLTVDVKIPLNK